jgi:hypothetical protein
MFAQLLTKIKVVLSIMFLNCLLKCFCFFVKKEKKKIKINFET